jgi:hypothetical protein
MEGGGMNEYVGQAQLSCGGELVEVWWETDDTFSLYTLDDSGNATGQAQHEVAPEKLKYYIILTEETEEWAFDNDVFL